MANGMHWSLYPKEGDTVRNVHEAGWVSGPVWMGPENLAPHWGSNPRTLQPVEGKGAFLKDSWNVDR